MPVTPDGMHTVVGGAAEPPPRHADPRHPDTPTPAMSSGSQLSDPPSGRDSMSTERTELGSSDAGSQLTMSAKDQSGSAGTSTGRDISWLTRKKKGALRWLYRRLLSSNLTQPPPTICVPVEFVSPRALLGAFTIRKSPQVCQQLPGGGGVIDPDSFHDDPGFSALMYYMPLRISLARQIRRIFLDLYDLDFCPHRPLFASGIFAPPQAAHEEIPSSSSAGAAAQTDEHCVFLSSTGDVRIMLAAYQSVLEDLTGGTGAAVPGEDEGGADDQVLPVFPPWSTIFDESRHLLDDDRGPAIFVEPFTHLSAVLASSRDTCPTVTAAFPNFFLARASPATNARLIPDFRHHGVFPLSLQQLEEGAQLEVQMVRGITLFLLDLAVAAVELISSWTPMLRWLAIYGFPVAAVSLVVLAMLRWKILVSTQYNRLWGFPKSRHRWTAFETANQPKYCSVCRQLISGFWIFRNTGWLCVVCQRTSHLSCLPGVEVFDCKCPSHPPTVLRHSWAEGNLPVDSICCVCGIICSSQFGLYGLRCLWCLRTIHNGCADRMQRIDNQWCDFGEMQTSLLPPTAVKLRLDYRNSFPRSYASHGAPGTEVSRRFPVVMQDAMAHSLREGIKEISTGVARLNQTLAKKLTRRHRREEIAQQDQEEDELLISPPLETSPLLLPTAAVEAGPSDVAPVSPRSEGESGAGIAGVSGELLAESRSAMEKVKKFPSDVGLQEKKIRPSGGATLSAERLSKIGRKPTRNKPKRTSNATSTVEEVTEMIQDHERMHEIAKRLPSTADVWALRMDPPAADPLCGIPPWTAVLPVGVVPVLVFVNSRSGGQLGATLLQEMYEKLNPIQVVSLTDAGPRPAIEVFRPMIDARKCRALVCGGDGSVGWVINETLAVYNTNRLPSNPMYAPPMPVAVLPLGTGNDLARVLGWGVQFDGNIKVYLNRVRDARESRLDIWTIRATHNESGREVNLRTSGYGPQLSKPESLQSWYPRAGFGAPPPPSPSSFAPSDAFGVSMLNYMDIGIAARIVMKFHTLREEHPQLFISRIANKAIYGEMGVREYLADTSIDLSGVRVWCDDKEVAIPETHIEGLIAVNIASFAGGVDLWKSSRYKMVARRSLMLQEFEAGRNPFISLSAGNRLPTTISEKRVAKVSNSHWESPQHSFRKKRYGVPRRPPPAMKPAAMMKRRSASLDEDLNNMADDEDATGDEASPAPFRANEIKRERRASREQEASSSADMRWNVYLEDGSQNMRGIGRVDPVQKDDKLRMRSSKFRRKYHPEPLYRPSSAEPRSSRASSGAKHASSSSSSSFTTKSSPLSNSPRQRKAPVCKTQPDLSQIEANDNQWRSRSEAARPFKLETRRPESYRSLDTEQWDVGGDKEYRAQVFQRQSMRDGLIEVVAVRSLFHLGQIQVGLAEPIRVCQGSSVVIQLPLPKTQQREFWRRRNTTVKDMADASVPFEVDGEPKGLPPGCCIHLEYQCSMPVLSAARQSAPGQPVEDTIQLRALQEGLRQSILNGVISVDQAGRVMGSVLQI